MPEEIAAILRRLDIGERNQSDLAKTITALTKDLGEMEKVLTMLTTEREVQKERDKNRNERFDRIENQLEGIKRLGWWVLATFGTSAIALIVNFTFRGGFHVP